MARLRERLQVGLIEERLLVTMMRTTVMDDFGRLPLKEWQHRARVAFTREARRQDVKT